MRNKKILISQNWLPTDVPGFDEQLARLTERGFTTELFPDVNVMNAQQLREYLPGTFAHICGGDDYNPEMMKFAREQGLEIISRIGVGYETVDVPAATENGIKVCITSGFPSRVVAEYTIGMMIMLSRKFIGNDRTVREGIWNKTRYMGHAVWEKTLGIIGFGDIGKQVARWAQPIGMKILAYDTIPDRAYALANDIRYVSLEELLRESDFVSVNVPLLPSTRNMISDREFDMMKPTAYFINTSRGFIVDEAALYRALTQGKIQGAAADVFDSEPINADNPLLTLDNIMFCPHTAGVSYEGLGYCFENAVQNVLDLLDGKVPKGLLNKSLLNN